MSKYDGLSKKDYVDVIREGYKKEICDEANDVKEKYYGKKVFLRGLIEISNYCKNECYYCGINRTNKNVTRYRMPKEDILRSCEIGNELGFKTFVLQGGEDNYFSEKVMCEIISSIKEKYSDVAITLSLGERSKETYKSFFDAGADRFLLRHETSNPKHYSKLHEDKLTLKNRIKCLYDLKEIGFQVGAGFMVGSPFQTLENLAEDLIFLKELEPHMVGIGPFIPQKETKFSDFEQGDLYQTLLMMSLTRIILPKVLLPATTALGTIHKNGREMGLKSGCNVVMPNLSPKDNRKNYSLYDNKLATGEEAAEGLEKLSAKIKSIELEVSMVRGDHVSVL